MKRYLSILTLLGLVMLLTTATFAQQGTRRPMADRPNVGKFQRGNAGSLNFLPDLTEEQQNQIRQIRVEAQKAHLPIRNEMREKQARLQTLMTSAEVDADEVDSVIEEIGTLRTGMMKMRFETRRELRALLTEEQRVLFDSRTGPMMRMHRHHRAQRMGQR